MKIAVIGSGVAGLASSIRMAIKGHQVTVYEKNSLPGGKLSEIKNKGYRFDTGPSLFTLPELVEELFTLAGKDIRKNFTYSKLETICKYFYTDGSRLNFYHSPEKLKEEINTKTDDGYNKVSEYLQKAEKVYNLSAPVFIFNSLHKLSNYLSKPYLKIVSRLHQLDFFRSMHRANSKKFKDERLVQLFDRFATYNGSNPYQAPATLNMIAHLENNVGAYFPVNGMYSIASSLEKLALESGVQFKYNTQVSQIIFEKSTACGLLVNNSIHIYDRIISNVDINYLAKNMMEHPRLKRIQSLEPSSSALIFYWGIKREFPELDLHNILFSGDYQSEFDAIFKEKNLSADPTVYIFISSKIVKTDAPANCENWFVMINSPANSGQNWNNLIKEARKNIIRKINKMLGADIELYIETENIASPVSIEEQTYSAGGALYGNSSNSMFSAFLRHPNYIRKLKNLYFTGGSVHPGGGIPLCLASAKIVDKEIPSAS